MHESEVLASISPKFSHLIIDLLRDCEIGICNGRVKVSDLASGYEMLFCNIFSR